MRLMYGKKDAERRADVYPNSALARERYRSPWRRDFARIIHSPSFRRQAGKCQLFPGAESDYFRTRLTHSLEVAQIGKSIAIKLNSLPALRDERLKIDTDIVEAACLIHDLGHPPFGHQGERALDNAMKEAGGFEGNAQTLRIIGRLEKRERERCTDLSGIDDEGEDRRLGLNLTARTMAAVLKYDHEISIKRKAGDDLAKGYYHTETALVRWIKERVCGDPDRVGFKTIECGIMDLADDIAYSTYDLEDAFKAKFISPLDMLAPSEELFQEVVDAVQRKLGKEISPEDVLEDLVDSLGNTLIRRGGLPSKISFAELARVHRVSKEMCDSGYARVDLTSSLVGYCLRSISFKLDPKCPALSKVWLHERALRRVEVLKKFAYHAIIRSPHLSVIQHRAEQIVGRVFSALNNTNGDGKMLLPADMRRVYDRIHGTLGPRVICDYVAGMTDKYCVEFFGRLASENPQSLFRPYS